MYTTFGDDILGRSPSSGVDELQQFAQSEDDISIGAVSTQTCAVYGEVDMGMVDALPVVRLPTTVHFNEVETSDVLDSTAGLLPQLHDEEVHHRRASSGDLQVQDFRYKPFLVLVVVF